MWVDESTPLIHQPMVGWAELQNLWPYSESGWIYSFSTQLVMSQLVWTRLSHFDMSITLFSKFNYIFKNNQKRW